MPRRRTKDTHLPRCVYQRHGAYWYVKAGKWTRLGATLAEAMGAYARLLEHRSASVQAFLERVLTDARERLAPSTVHQYETAARKLGEILRDFDVDQVEPRHVAQIMDHLRHTPNMANRCRTVLKLALDQAVRAGLIAANPVIAIQRHREGRRDRYLTDAEYRAIFEAAPLPLRQIMELCYLTAQRIGDVLAIRHKDLADDGILIRQRKTGRALLIRWSPELTALVEAIKADRPKRKVVRLDNNPYLIAQRNGQPRGYGGVRDLWHRACARAGIADAHLHDLRAKALTDADRQGLDATHLAGHTSPAMTQRYLRDKTPLAVDGPRRAG